MVQLIIGLKGSGKTKKLVDMVRAAVNEETGDVVCIEKERKLTFDIPYQARLIDAGIYDIGSYEFLRGLICGVHAGNYDITHFFIDNFYKLVNDKSPEALVDFLTWLDKFSEREKISFVISLSIDAAALPTEVLLQEGVPTRERVESAVAESWVYSIDRYIVGGYYCVHDGDASEMCDTCGSFVPQAIVEPPQLPRAGAPDHNRFYMYGVIARLALVAASYELEATDPEWQALQDEEE